MLIWIPFWSDSDIFPNTYWESSTFTIISWLGFLNWIFKVNLNC